MKVIITLLVLICAILFVAYLKNKLMNTVICLYMAEENIAPPSEEYGRVLAEKVVRHWFYKD